ncbi:nikA [Symbiodinium natans]|uniref:NikA protein n=1 Tax=Symbiodinium natans TaxID=878477 RepID=A0A812L0V5_9DINO|nr:nikA [Symbiodinium natans]
MAPLLLCALFWTASGQLTGPLIVGKTFMAGSTDPTSGSTAWALTSHGISEKLFTVDDTGSIVPQVGQSVSKVDTFTWDVTLKSDYKFSDGTAVTAQHVADCLGEMNRLSSNAQASLGTMTLTARDASTVRIVSDRATPVMDAVLAEWPFVVYVVKNGQRYFTGPYLVAHFAANNHINLVPNTYYPRAAERPTLEIKKFADGNAVAQALEQGQVDMAFHLPVDELPALRQLSGITVKSFLVGYHYMMWHNSRREPLSDKRLRKAIDMALDRQELTQELRGGRPTRSLFPENSPYDLGEAVPHADKSGAEALIETAGWVKNASGFYEKSGAPLTVRAVAYPQRPGLVLMLPVIKQRLEALGIVVDAHVTSGSSWDELDGIIAGRDYDLLLWAQHTLPAGDPSWFLNSFFRSDGGNNHGGLNSTAVDDLLTDLGHAEEHITRVSDTRTVHQAILEEVPVSNLMTPSWHVGLSSRLSEYVPWGSDYYVIHSDFGLPATTSTTTGQSTDVSAAHQSWFSAIGLMACALLTSQL